MGGVDLRQQDRTKKGKLATRVVTVLLTSVYEVLRADLHVNQR